MFKKTAAVDTVNTVIIQCDGYLLRVRVRERLEMCTVKTDVMIVREEENGPHTYVRVIDPDCLLATAIKGLSPNTNDHWFKLALQNGLLWAKPHSEKNPDGPAVWEAFLRAIYSN